ncbi:NADH-quinone oxidoreductase subunit J [Nocardioides sp. NPDC101246]|uniref:NADH-quinone oxidoreductase subunit J n=1 Tax=Nocardioides sp. NPDC101246 TaxID=3364336 RepID=UPI00381D0EC1
MSFVILASVTVIAAVGLLFARKPVHAALSLAVVMIGLAMIYATLEAPFLFAVQIVVYTGAILMLFLFVIMLVGVDTSDRLKETIAGQKVLAVVLGVALGATLIAGIGQASIATMRGLASANEGGNVQRLADLLFSRYVIAFEATSALLITAAIGAMVLAHRERIDPKQSQTDLAQKRVADYAKSGKHLGPLPPPGTFARHNSNDTPALLPDGSQSTKSVPAILAGGNSNGSADEGQGE